MFSMRSSSISWRRIVYRYCSGSSLARRMRARQLFFGPASSLRSCSSAGRPADLCSVSSRTGSDGKRTLLITILVYSVGSALCAMSQDIWQLAAFRAVASLGIGGEWAVGAALVAEVVPDSRRVEAGSILFTASPLGFALAGFLNYQIAGVWLAGSPETSWRYVLLCGLIPAALAIQVRWFLRESERWQQAAKREAPPRPGALFSDALRPRTISGLFTAVMASADVVDDRRLLAPALGKPRARSRVVERI